MSVCGCDECECDSEEWPDWPNDWGMRWRFWRMKWLPHRTAEYLGDKDGEFLLGPWEWQRPYVLRSRKP